MMIKSLAVQRSKKILSKTPVFYGTRVPVSTLIDYLEAGEKIDDFLKNFPSVTHKQTLAAVKIHKQKLKQRLF